jgi:glycosyltransferase involved in cell wall biosynthesis
VNTPARTAGEPVGEGAPAQRLSMRTALIHDWFQGMHGAERTAAGMFDAFERDPDVFTFHAEPDLLPPRVASAIVKQSRLAALPGVRQRGHNPGRWRWLLPYMPYYFEHLDLDQYELVISSSHACAAGVKTPSDALHFCYCHTPMRYVWMPEAERNRVAGLKGVALAALRGRLRDWDRRASARPDLYLANSTAVVQRIKDFYGRDAELVPPPVAVGDFPVGVPRDPQRFLWVHRLVPYKRPLEVAEAFRELPELRLTMVGVGPLEARLRATLPDNVELLGWVPRERLAELFAGAAGFIHVGEEDFGISMVEALAAGAPVLGADTGGARDIVRPERDGVLISDPADPAHIRAGVRELVRRDWDADALRESAQRFSEERFRARLAEVLRAHGAS